MKRSPIKFPRRVRIHGGEFDASARAMHRSVRLAVPATIENVSVVTIERKQMSTKTTIKRIALVAVAAVGFGMLSALPSQATINQDSLVLSSATAAQTTAETKTATSAVATAYFFGVAGDSMSVTAALVSAPAGNTSLPILQLIDTSSATVDTVNGASQVAGYLVTPNTATKVAAISPSVGTQARFAVYLSPDVSTGLTAPTVAGTYVVKLTPATVGSSGALNAAVAQTLTITVTAATTLSTVATSATAVLGGLANPDSITSTTDEVVTASKTLRTTGGQPDAVISVVLKNAAGTTLTTSQGESYTAYIVSGPGTLTSGTPGSGLITQVAGQVSGTGRLIAVKVGNNVAVYSDGTSGVSTIQILSKAGAVLATKSVTFYGALDKITAKANTPVIGVRAGAAASSKAIVFNAYDAAGTEIKTGISTVYLNSSDTTIIKGAYTSATPTYDATTLKAWYVDVTAVKQGTASVTITTNSAATVTTGVTSGAVSLRVAGGTAAAAGTNALSDVIVAFDKATYAPGEAATITVTPVDSAGLILADDTYTVFSSTGLVSDYAFYGGVSAANLASASAQDGGVAGTGTTLGVASYKVFMPISEGNVTLKYTTAAGVGSTTGAIARSVVATVSSTSGSAAIEAANAAQASADAATDAANAAAESADAATAAALDAGQAVADLATQVADLIASLKAQLTALTALVVKIQKKVKA
jgi:trimeric autotransporter adhesin